MDKKTYELFEVNFEGFEVNFEIIEKYQINFKQFLQTGTTMSINISMKNYFHEVEKNDFQKIQGILDAYYDFFGEFE